MKIVYFGKGLRGFKSLEAVLDAGYEVGLVVGHDNDKRGEFSVLTLAERRGIETVAPADVNSSETETFLSSREADVFVLGGYGNIIKANIIDIPRIMTVNLHGGRLPQRRGSSPLNWALIEGDSSFTLSIIKVDSGVDTGDIIHETTHQIGANDTIVDLHRIANNVFPQMLLEVLQQLENGEYSLKKQESKEAAYYPLRFPDDGFILFDQLTAQEVHNRIRALTEPYPCAFSFYDGRKVRFISSQLTAVPFYGEPGRIYKKNGKGVLVCCKDRCLWLTQAVFEDNGQELHRAVEVERYKKFSTTRDFILNYYRDVKET